MHDFCPFYAFFLCKSCLSELLRTFLPVQANNFFSFSESSNIPLKGVTNTPNFGIPCMYRPVHLILHYLLSFRNCECSAGTDADNSQCNQKGECSCKRNVVGAKCGQCRQGFYALEASNPHGCKQCFCYGHSTVCQAASGFTSRNFTSDFIAGLDGWTTVNEQGLFCLKSAFNRLYSRSKYVHL